MDVSTFYSTTSALCFTLLGFWWVVVEFRHGELMRDRSLRRFAFIVSLHFVLPGLMSMAALISTGPLWRLTFGLAGVSGIVAVVVGLGFGGRPGPLRRLGRAAWIGVPLYALLTVVAIVPELTRSAFGLEPLQVEGFILVGLLLLGIMLAWLLFTAPAADPEPATPAG